MPGPQRLLEQIPGMGAESIYYNFLVKNKALFAHGHCQILLPREKESGPAGAFQPRAGVSLEDSQSRCSVPVLGRGRRGPS